MKLLMNGIGNCVFERIAVRVGQWDGSKIALPPKLDREPPLSMGEPFRRREAEELIPVVVFRCLGCLEYIVEATGMDQFPGQGREVWGGTRASA